MRPNEAGIRLPELHRQVIQLERGFYMRTMLFAITALLLLGTPAQGQFAEQAPSLIGVATGIEPTAPLAPMLPAPVAAQQGGMPSWITWGLVGGAGFALAVAATHGAGAAHLTLPEAVRCCLQAQQGSRLWVAVSRFISGCVPVAPGRGVAGCAAADFPWAATR
jgi:hypothetical protein